VFIEERNNTWNTPYLFNAKELDEETGLYYYGARYYDPRTSIWLSTDPLQEKYPSVSTYAYCGNNPVMNIDPTGMDWYEYTDKDGNSQTLWRKSQDKTYTDDNGNIWNNIGENYLSMSGDNATLFTQHTNDKGELYLRSSVYNLADEKSTNSLTSTLGDILSKGSAIAGVIGGTAEGSKATFRLTNSKGALDFKFYGNGWTGNQWVTPNSMSNLGKVVGWASRAAGVLSIGISVNTFLQSTTIENKVKHGLDAFMGELGYVPVAGTAISVFWNLGGKQLHWNHIENYVMPAIQMELPPYSYMPFK
jgi:RHS repeat-associated protein